MKKITPKQQHQHDLARAAWAGMRVGSRWTSRSPVDGLSERLRAIPKPIDPERRKALRANHIKELQEAVKRNTIRVAPRITCGNAYYPHQGAREIARRLGR